MVSVSASVDVESADALSEAVAAYQSSLTKDAETAPRRAAILVCKRLQSRTKVANQNKGFKPIISEERPEWITYKDGKKLVTPLRRWRVTLTDRGRTFTKYVWAGTRQEMRQRLKREVGINYLPLDAKGSGLRKKGGVRGLAKKSWGWVMHNIYNGEASDTPWSRRRRDRRSPKDATKDSMSKPFLAVISNRLDYIVDAIEAKGATVNEAVVSATNTIIKRIKTNNFGRG